MKNQSHAQHNLFSGFYSDVGEYLRDEVSPLSTSSTPLSSPRCGGIGNWEFNPTDVLFVTFVGNPILRGATECSFSFVFFYDILGIIDLGLKCSAVEISCPTVVCIIRCISTRHCSFSSVVFLWLINAMLCTRLILVVPRTLELLTTGRHGICGVELALPSATMVATRHGRENEQPCSRPS